MSDRPLSAIDAPIVRLEVVRKVYRLYQKPMYKFLDLFGLCPEDSSYFTEHEALADVDLTIGRGEKVAIIGRNGAGKSTMLKIITGLVQPTSGVVDVRGRISNLLQLGSGFHPDFTGRQNVFAGLAHQGIIGAHAAKLFNDIVEFSEIEEYIDQPMKTYSTGMCSRLMFASSVVMSPEILVVDEILGVGDAYFSHKSFGRMRDLCSNDGTTLLLVTHDIYSALNLCERFIWIDRGRIRFDGDGKGAIALYETSVKEQEEQSLRQQNAANLRAERADPIVHVVLRSQTGFALSRPLALSTLEISDSAGGSLLLNVADGDPRWHLVAESNLGDPELVDGVRARALRTFGSIYHKAEWTVQLPDGFEIERVRVRWRYQGDDPIELRVISTKQDVIVRGELRAGRPVAGGGVRPGAGGPAGGESSQASRLRDRSDPDHRRRVSRSGRPEHHAGQARRLADDQDPLPIVHGGARKRRDLLHRLRAPGVCVPVVHLRSAPSHSRHGRVRHRQSRRRRSPRQRSVVCQSRRRRRGHVQADDASVFFRG